MIVHIEFKDGRHKYIPLAETIELKEYHLIIHTTEGTEIETRSGIEKVSCVGV